VSGELPTRYEDRDGSMDAIPELATLEAAYRLRHAGRALRNEIETRAQTGRRAERSQLRWRWSL